MRIDGKISVVTGAGQGIGAAIAKRFHNDGATVALLDINAEAVSKAAKEIDHSEQRAKAFACNVADRENVAMTFNKIYDMFGRVDILVNNAGITKDGMFHKLDDDAWDAVISVNLNGVANCCKAVVPVMREQGYGKIVNIASVSAFGNLGQVNYGAAKAGVIGLTKCLAKELARYNCTVNCIAPSYIDTEMLRSVPDNVMERFIASIPIGRLGTPEELASAVSFLSCDDSSFITGECIVVSGGSYM